ncbi:hypothetical protein IJD44_04720 [bacterium]|nr:hypothetical protein [bacterium]
MKKFFLIVANIIGILLVLLAIEYLVYTASIEEFRKVINDRPPNKFSYSFKETYWPNMNNYFNGENNTTFGRKPDGLEYNSTPITIFGCSYAHGQYLNYNQTFSYKLAHSLKRPVYNRSVPAKGFSKMYYQSENESFYREVPASDLVIYIMIEDHYRRMKLNYLNVTDNAMKTTYKKVGDKLVKEDFSNPIKYFVNSTYTFKHLKNKWVDLYINDPQNAEKLTDEALLYFIETRKNLEKMWNRKIDFVVIFYNTWQSHQDMLKEKLEKNNFKVIKMQELTNEDLFTEKYFSPQTLHPTEAVWDLLTPKIIEKLEL